MVRSRRRLRSLTVLAAGRTLRTWAEDETSDLLDAAAPRADLIAYRARVAGAAGEAEFLRVVVEDEAGGREVRTIPVPRAGTGDDE